jgi:hypothetical protein
MSQRFRQRCVQDPRASGVLERFTSISGPDLGHFHRWMDSRACSLRGWRQLAGRLLHSSYVAAFQIPRLPEAVWRLFLTRLYEKAAGRRVNDDAVRGLALNRSNFFPSGNVPPPTPIRIPVNVVAHLLQRSRVPHGHGEAPGEVVVVVLPGRGPVGHGLAGCSRRPRSSSF